MREEDKQRNPRGEGERRRGAMVAVGELLARATPDHGVDWAVLVGAGLAETTLALGVNDAGVLRVMAAHETALKELQARSGNVLEVWNLAAKQANQVLARDLQCWVRPGLVIPSRTLPVKVRPQVKELFVSEEHRNAASETAATIRNQEVKDALADMRARALAARERQMKKGES